jgi:hypothetical protein
VDSGGQPCNGKATDDTDRSNVPGCPAAHPQRNNGSAIRIHLPTPLEPETTMVRTCRSIARWLTRAAKWVAILYGGIGRHWQPLAFRVIDDGINPGRTRPTGRQQVAYRSRMSASALRSLGDVGRKSAVPRRR